MRHEIETCGSQEDEKFRAFLQKVCEAASEKHGAFEWRVNTDSPKVRIIAHCNGKALLDLVKALDHFGLLP